MEATADIPRCSLDFETFSIEVRFFLNPVMFVDTRHAGDAAVR